MLWPVVYNRRNESSESSLALDTELAEAFGLVSGASSLAEIHELPLASRDAILGAILVAASNRGKGASNHLMSDRTPVLVRNFHLRQSYVDC